MANETRVHIRHLLEDLRDTYKASLEEVIVTELIANALDSRASRIALKANASTRTFRCIDDGEGMNRVQLHSYHNIAASTKERGFGIGFAGVGAKLSLLVAEDVTTESRGRRGSRAAARWYLRDAYRAPWKFVPFSGLIESGRGTAVTLRLKDEQSKLLDPAFLDTAVKRHFYSLVVEHEGLRKIARALYRKQIAITVNGRLVSEKVNSSVLDIVVRRDKGRAVIGAGFLEKARIDQNFWSRFLGRAHEIPQSGLNVSTYGKVIKGGWEWIGIMPKNPSLVSGIVEVPELSSLLTTNKSDFMSDAASLKKYYRIRKSIQNALRPVLRSLGESREEGAGAKTPLSWKPLTRNIEEALAAMSASFPELQSLVGERRVALGEGDESRGREKPESVSVVIVPPETAGSADHAVEKAAQKGTAAGEPGSRRAKRPGLTILFEQFIAREKKQLGKLIEDSVIVNTAHPAWKIAEEMSQQHYHVVMTVGLVLSEELRPDLSASDFVSAFLSAWSSASHKSGRLF